MNSAFSTANQVLDLPPQFAEVPIRLIAQAEAPPMRAYRDAGVVVNTHKSAHTAAYVGIPERYCLQLLGVMGAMQWRIMRDAPHFEPDDFAHTRPKCCVMSEVADWAEFAANLERPRICDGSRWFYKQTACASDWQYFEELVARCADIREKGNAA